MIVPQFWAEGRLQRREKGRQVTVRRFGWSDSSAAEAQASADVRVKEALERLLAGEKLARREPKIPYNGAAGVPIREEIVSRHVETIITRNSYGARCLNTPNVLFADIDFAQDASLRFKFGVFAALVLCASAIAWATHSRATGVTLAILAIFFASSISGAIYRGVLKAQGGAERVARNRIRRFLDKHPEWNLRLYKTPAGMRVLATHRPFSPSEPAVAECFEALDADPVYATMCLNQQCFRARVSAKPWRIGVQGHLRPRPGVWPVAPERLPIRNAWIAEYEKAASAYCACSFLESIGSGTVHPATQSVQELHDELCSATSNLPIA